MGVPVVGFAVGTRDTKRVGVTLGLAVGFTEGLRVVGTTVGTRVGAIEG